MGFHLQILGVEKHVGHTATAAIGFVIRLIASNPSLARWSFVWLGSGSMIGNLWYTETATSNGYDEKYQKKK